MREGSKEDFYNLCHLIKSSGNRKNYIENTKDDLINMWEIFSRFGFIKIFCVENNGELISSLAVIPYRDTVTLWRAGWSGEHGNLYPNEALFWGAIQWAKIHNYHYFDLGGIQKSVAKRTLHGEEIPRENMKSVTFFKIGLGGQIILAPATYEIIYNPIIKNIYYSLYPMVKNRIDKRKILGTISRW